MVDDLERMNHALQRIEGGKIKAISDGDRVYLMIQDAPEELPVIFSGRTVDGGGGWWSPLRRRSGGR